MKMYLVSVRPVNLFMILITQYLFYSFFFMPLAEVPMPLVLYPSYHWYFIGFTILLSAGGYLINDHFDLVTDRINNKDRKAIPAIYRLIFYYIISIVGFLMAVYITHGTGKMLFIIIYLFTFVVLFLYSSFFKGIPLVGNFIISLLAPLVFILFMLVEIDALNLLRSQYPQLYNFTWSTMGFFALFAFWINMYRELMKDAEDIAGDRYSGIKTFPLLYGIKPTNYLGILYVILMIILLGIWGFSSIFAHGHIVEKIYFIICLIIPFIYLAFKTFYFAAYEDYHFGSNFSKWLMFAGLIFIALQKWI